MAVSYQEKTLELNKLPDKKISEVLRQHDIGLTADEAKKVQKMLGRDPTLTEATIWSTQASEHSSYKSSKHILKRLPTDGPNVIMGPGQDAGIVEIAKVDGKKYGLVVCHESHNHPSQIVPYEGAATGIGGSVRDVLCMGARVIGLADSLRFGEIKRNETKLIAEGVIDGIAGYGNPIGVPNVGGDVYFDKSFNENCLVNVVALGLVREDEIIHSKAPRGAAINGFDIILVGKPTDLSGFGGASFASFQLNEEAREKNKGAVQEPNPFLKRHLLAATYDLFDILKKKNLLNKVGFKDLGAGGVMCSTVEMVAAQGYGAEIDLKKVHRAIEDLPPQVIACSETQERFCWMVPPQLTKLILKHYNETWDLPIIAKGAQASVIGKVTKGNYVMTYDGVRVCDAKAEDITAGISIQRPAKAKRKPLKEPKFAEPRNLSKIFLDMLRHENIASRAPIFESYDKNVQGISKHEAGTADAGVLVPFENRDDVDAATRKIGIAISSDANPRYGHIDAYWQAVNAVFEGCRNVAAVGATPWAVTDCLNYGNPEKPDHMFEFEEGVEGIKDACEGIGLRGHEGAPLPVISGNVSFYNATDKTKIAPQANICTIGRIENVDHMVASHLQNPKNDLFLIGARKMELGGSVYYDMMGHLGSELPQPDPEDVANEIELVLRMAEEDLMASCHDISDGGLAVALAEMMIDSSVGIKVDITRIGARTGGKAGAKSKRTKGMRSDHKLFTETGGFVVEIPRAKVGDAIKIAKEVGVPLIRLGSTTQKRRLRIFDNGSEIINLRGPALERAYHNGLRDKLR